MKDHFYCLVACFVLSQTALCEEYRYTLPDIPDPLIVETYKQAAEKNIIACVNNNIFPGYWSVCADGQGFGYGNSYPSLDGHQIADALLRLGGYETLKLNWDYVRSFQRDDGSLPLAILPAQAGHTLPYHTPVDPNGGLYKHWVPGNPLEALASPTYIANAAIIYAAGQDKEWLKAQIESINLSADCLVSLVTEEGRVRGAGYYIERPTRIDSDGVAQCYAIDAFLQVSELNDILGRKEDAERYGNLAKKIRHYFTNKFWHENKFAEYFNPEHGFITAHGLTDTDWASIALRVATKEQTKILYPQLINDKGFIYGTMPAAISTKPDTYEDWEFTHPDRYDLSAMGRVWYLTAMAHANMRDPDRLIAGLHAVAEQGKLNGYYWHERYHPSDNQENRPAGPITYCEYPANFIRIVQRFLLGVDLRIDGAIVLAPNVPDVYREKGFGQEIRLPRRTLSYHWHAFHIKGTWRGQNEQQLGVRLNGIDGENHQYRVSVDGKPVVAAMRHDILFFVLPPCENVIEWEVTRR